MCNFTNKKVKELTRKELKKFLKGELFVRVDSDYRVSYTFNDDRISGIYICLSGMPTTDNED